MITTDSELKQLASILINEDIIGIDTEFDWRVTYFPKLCLIQIATVDNAYLIDPLSIGDLSPLKPILESNTIIKVFHSPTYDLKILNQQTGAMIQHVFDTQLAAEFLGFSHQPSLNDLLSWLIQKTLDKSVKLSNWNQRPLTEKQRNYALEDVKYLIPAFNHLTDKLSASKRLKWFHYEINDRFNESFYQPIDTTVAYLKLKRYKNFKNGQFEYLKALATWRENTAIHLNKPIRRILDDHSIYQIVYNPPADLEQLADRFYQLHKKQHELYGEEILDVINDTNKQLIGLTNIEKPSVQKSRPFDDEIFQTIYNYFKGYCEQNSIISQMIATRAELKQFVIRPSNPNHKLNQNWRYEFIGKELAKQLTSLANS
ncbi:HRDC domain-containing protein [Thiotrichales bacterium 19S3-7]|nr:HRDC domain-containing protein [Thiotrichales bacterium 19S3-7]MCF6800768.1 HRDC domain-containing protein [Thiotrichales bacterium 19S3-11]